MIHRECSKCGQVKPVETEYYWWRGNLASSKCKECVKAEARARRAAKPKPPKRLTERDLTEKRCNVCGIVKPVSEFYWNQRKWSRQCKPCRREEERQKRRNDPEGVRAKSRSKWQRESYRVAALASCHAYYTANRERLQEASRVWYAANLEKSSQQSRAWRLANPERTLELAIRRRARIAGASRIEPIDRAAIIARDEGRCYLCGGYPTGWNLTLDHVVPLTRGGGHCAENLRVACRSCNSKKRTRLLEELHVTLLRQPT